MLFGIAHFIPNACAESAVNTWLLAPTGSLASAVSKVKMSPLVVSGEPAPMFDRFLTAPP